MTETQQQVLSWLANGETGASSECMAFWLAFEIPKGSWQHDHPYDPGDFGRCLKLLERAPGLRERLSDMADLSPEWAALVGRWDEIEALFYEEGRAAPKTYALMREVLDGVNA